jgi:hypothetical protein
MSENKVKIINKNGHRVGLRLMDGIREVTVQANSFTLLDENEIYFINSTSKTFSGKHLKIENDEINTNLGYEIDSVDTLSDDEIVDLLKGSLAKIKKEFETISEKHIIDKVINVAKTVDDLAKNKITYLQEWSGYDFDQLVEETDDSNKEEK